MKTKFTTRCLGHGLRNISDLDDVPQTAEQKHRHSTPLSERKQRLHRAKRMGKFTVARNFPLAHKGCLTGRFLMETEINLPNSILLMALQVQSRALETEVWKALVNKKEYSAYAQEKQLERHNNMVRRIAKALSEVGWFVEQKKFFGAEFDFVLRPDLIAVKGNVAAIIELAIIGDLLSLDCFYRTNKLQYNKLVVRRSLSQINGLEKHDVQHVIPLIMNLRATYSGLSGLVFD
ncbi:unnamed protein product [Lepeophtheirus salmonis]|uniref:(salmon louse) hypothetical protein n=1 Tax=Lepeophtheirus salmonis TaxID=72036 RepID=A0A7R8CH47_LEPSM|nr:unnamed protein product [Lepeophtheirus salmonis]CAF2821013.1 unnamed protein product [Lepeophtheirus salmonis]